MFFKKLKIRSSLPDNELDLKISELVASLSGSEKDYKESSNTDDKIKCLGHELEIMSELEKFYGARLIRIVDRYKEILLVYEKEKDNILKKIHDLEVRHKNDDEKIFRFRKEEYEKEKQRLKKNLTDCENTEKNIEKLKDNVEEICSDCKKRIKKIQDDAWI